MGRHEPAHVLGYPRMADPAARRLLLSDAGCPRASADVDWPRDRGADVAGWACRHPWARLTRHCQRCSPAVGPATANRGSLAAFIPSTVHRGFHRTFHRTPFKRSINSHAQSACTRAQARDLIEFSGSDRFFSGVFKCCSILVVYQYPLEPPRQDLSDGDILVIETIMLP